MKNNDLMGRLLSSLFFLGLLIFLEFYVFNGLKTLFKNGMPRGLKWTYWIVTLFPIFWMFFYISVQGQIGNLRWLNNLIIGVSFTLLITKAFFAIFLLAEDAYRILRFGGGQLMAMTDKKGPSVAWESRRLFVAQLGLALASIPFMSFIYGVTRGKYAYTIHKSTLTFPDLPDAFDGFRIVQISDIHAGSFDNIAAVERGTRMIQAQKGDLILFTGDLVNNVATEIEPYIHLFKVLDAPYGKFSVLGNHDYATYIRWENEAAAIENMARLERNHEAMGFKLMKNESLLLEKDGKSIRLGGVENWGRGHFPKEGDLNKTFDATPENEFTILMSHDPSHWKEHILDFQKHVHLTLSGHTHGMQLGIEVPGIKWSPSKWIYPQWAGLYEDNGKRIYVNRGFGFLGFPGRVGILPEITVLELRKG